MKNSLTSEEDKNLCLVLAHEYRRCDQAFIDFLEHASNQIGLGWTKHNALSTYDSYARFLHHLYEFYVGCFKRDKKSLKTINHTDLDALFKQEAEKLMGIRRWRIEGGRADKSENHISYYQVAVPDEFATEFRRIRNRVAHTDLHRAGANNALTLPGFYEKYHKFIMVLYEEPYGLWHMKADKCDWGEIEKFGKIASNITNKKSSLMEKIKNYIFFKQVKNAILQRRQKSS